MQQVCFFASHELENNFLVVEKCACVPKTFGIILAIDTYINKFLRLPERGSNIHEPSLSTAMQENVPSRLRGAVNTQTLSMLHEIFFMLTNKLFLRVKSAFTLDNTRKK